MSNEYGAVGGMRIDGGTEVLWENLPHYLFVDQKSRMNSPGIEPVSPRWESGDE
jgi:hypothetical protein